jgi:hypothetical protein
MVERLKKVIKGEMRRRSKKLKEKVKYRKGGGGEDKFE